MQQPRVKAEIVIEGTQRQIDTILELIDEITRPCEIVWVEQNGERIPILWFQGYFDGKA